MYMQKEKLRRDCIELTGIIENYHTNINYHANTYRFWMY